MFKTVLRISADDMQDLARRFSREWDSHVELPRIGPEAVSGLRVRKPDVSLERKMQPKDFFPKVKRIVYNDPATKVWFDDGTSVLVKTSSSDKFSKELGLVYALLKRLFGKPDENGNVSSDGYMCELTRLSESAYDQKAAERKKAAERAKENPKKDPPPKKGSSQKKPSGKKRA